MVGTLLKTIPTPSNLTSRRKLGYDTLYMSPEIHLTQTQAFHCHFRLVLIVSFCVHSIFGLFVHHFKRLFVSKGPSWGAAPNGAPQEFSGPRKEAAPHLGSAL